MGWLYGVPAANRFLISWRRYIYVPLISSMAWTGTPSDQVLAQGKWPTVKDLYEYRSLMLAHDCFYNFLPVPRSCLRNMSATITCEGN